MTRARSDGRIFLGLGILTLILLGLFFRYSAGDSMVDFQEVYSGARLLLQHQDPYDPALMTRMYGQLGEASFVAQHRAMTFSVYFPAGFLVLEPVAALPWKIAAIFWNLLTLGSLIGAGYLIWRIGAEYSPVLTGGLIAFALVNGAVVFANGNPAGIVVGLCVIAAWCLSQERLVWAGILCLVVSLTLKPQDAGLIWLFFLLRPGVFRKRALHAAVIVMLLGVLAAAWTWHIAPRWLPELHSNFAAWSGRGGNCDPGPTGLTAKTGTMEVITDLQTVVSVFRDSPVFYNSVTFLFCGFLLAIWAIAVLRSNSSPISLWLALAVIAPLSLLVTYHRAYDARLLLLCVPACAMLWARRGWIAKLALAFTIAGFVFTGEIPLAVLNTLTRPLHLGTATLPQKIATVALARPATLSLLAMTIFYLWVLVREKRLEIGSLAAVAVGERAVSAGNP